MNEATPECIPDLSGAEALALAVVHEACAIAQAVAIGGTATTIVKLDHSPVTVADFAVQCWVAHRLGGAGIGVPLIGEESAAGLEAGGPGMLAAVHAALPAHDRPDRPADLPGLLAAASAGLAASGDWWLLDPIDGTRGYLRGGQYAVCLALVREGRPVLGLLGCPALPPKGLPPVPVAGPDAAGVLLLGRRGRGAWQRPLAGATPWRAIHCSDSGPAGGQVRVCESREWRHGRRGLLDDSLARLGATPTPVRLDSQCKYALVARGDADVYVRLPRDPNYEEKTWDHAAGAVIAEAAGARVSDLDGRPLDFSQGTRLPGRGVLVASPAWHAALVEDSREER
jgi:3'(2'), 5'-bisphosphate nucleotidase